MTMLTNDLSEIVKKKLSVLMHGGDASSNTEQQPLTNPEVLSDNEAPDNPLISSGFKPFRFIIGASIGFWVMVLVQFWWMPLLMAVLTYLMVGPEALSGAYDNITFSQIFVSAAMWGIPATLLAVTTYWRVAAKLARGTMIERKSILLWQLPALFFAGFTLYDLSHVILKFFF